jgi:HAD superfamily hydrolase (TIGR01509 family)
MTLEAVLFDMDGVLIDARDWHFDALNESLKIFGLTITRDDHLGRFNGLTTKKKLAILTEENGLAVDLHEVIEAVKQDRTLRIAAQKCFPNVAHQVLITRLKANGIRVGLVTNSIRKTTEFMLEYAGLLHFMDVVITNEDVKEGKPSPEGYLLAMKTLGVSPGSCIVVEDGEYGIAAAESAGAIVLRVNEPKDVSLELLLPLIAELR